MKVFDAYRYRIYRQYANPFIAVALACHPLLWYGSAAIIGIIIGIMVPA